MNEEQLIQSNYFDEPPEHIGREWMIDDNARCPHCGKVIYVAEIPDYSRSYLAWLKISADLAELKKKEMPLRKELVASFADEMVPGTYHKIIGDLKFTGTIKRNYKVDKDELEVLWPELTLAEQECINYKPEIKVKNFKALDPSQSVLVKIVNETPAAPSLAAKPIKK